MIHARSQGEKGDPAVRWRSGHSLPATGQSRVGTACQGAVSGEHDALGAAEEVSLVGQSVSPFGQGLYHLCFHGGLEREPAVLVASPTRGVDGLLRRHSEVYDVRQYLKQTLGLLIAADASDHEERPGFPFPDQTGSHSAEEFILRVAEGPQPKPNLTTELHGLTRISKKLLDQ